MQYTKPESVFQFTLRSSQNHPSPSDLQNINTEIAKCDVILENTTPSLGVTNEMVHPQNQVQQVKTLINNKALIHLSMIRITSMSSAQMFP